MKYFLTINPEVKSQRAYNIQIKKPSVIDGFIFICFSQSERSPVCLFPFYGFE